MVAKWRLWRRPSVGQRDLAQPRSTIRSSAWYRLLRRKSATLSLLIILAFSFVALFAPALAPHSPHEQAMARKYLSPSWTPTTVIDGTETVTKQFWLGTDLLGRDILSRAIYGTRTSMFISITAALLIAIMGTLIGVLSGYFGGQVDMVVMRVADIFYAFPTILFYILVTFLLRETMFGKWMGGLAMVVVAFVLVNWVGLARLVRAITLSLKEQEFVNAARCLGASHGRILWRHILPNTISLVVVWMSFIIPRVIVAEAILGYLGIGIQTGGEGGEFIVTSWGGLFLDGRVVMAHHPTMLIVATLCVGLVGSAFTFLSDNLRDVLDPNLRNTLS